MYALLFSRHDFPRRFSFLHLELLFSVTLFSIHFVPTLHAYVYHFKGKNPDKHSPSNLRLRYNFPPSGGFSSLTFKTHLLSAVTLVLTFVWWQPCILFVLYNSISYIVQAKRSSQDLTRCLSGQQYHRLIGEKSFVGLEMKLSYHEFRSYSWLGTMYRNEILKQNRLTDVCVWRPHQQGVPIHPIRPTTSTF